MKTNTLCLLLFLFSLFGLAQDKQYRPVKLLVTKKTIQFGFQISPSFGISSEGQRISSSVFNPKISYFLADRFSIGLGYIGSSTHIRPARIHKFNHTAEVELKYYVKSRGSTLFYTHTGFLYGQYSPAPGMGPIQMQPASMLKLGAGVVWKIKNNPNFAFNLEVNDYFVLTPKSKGGIRHIPNISVGLIYYFNSHRTKKHGRSLGDF